MHDIPACSAIQDTRSRIALLQSEAKIGGNH